MLQPSQHGARRLIAGAKFEVHAVELAGRDGRTHRREVVVHPGAAVILPLLDAGRVVLIRNRRFAVGEVLLELPAGTLEPPEPPEVTAARELEEETGYQAASLRPLLNFYSCPGFCTERLWVFVATGLAPAEQRLEATEEIAVEVHPLAEAVAMVRDGRIRDAKTIAALLYYHCLANPPEARPPGNPGSPGRGGMGGSGGQDPE